MRWPWSKPNVRLNEHFFFDLGERLDLEARIIRREQRERDRKAMLDRGRDARTGKARRVQRTRGPHGAHIHP